MFDGSGGITTRSLDLDSNLKWVHTYLVQDDILDLQHKPQQGLHHQQQKPPPQQEEASRIFQPSADLPNQGRNGHRCEKN